jgi:ribosomal small subunit protein bTHX
MGRGDKKTKKGKRTMGSHGNTRPKKESTSSSAVVAEKPKTEKVVKEKKVAVKKATTKTAAKTTVKKVVKKAETKAETETKKEK